MRLESTPTASQPIIVQYRPDGDAGSNGKVKQQKDDPLAIVRKENRTDIANARRFARTSKGRFRYCGPWRKWLVWTGQRWQIDDTGEVICRAKSVSDDLWREARRHNSREAIQFAAKSASDRSVRAMLSLAQSEPGIPMLPEEFDSHPWLLNCQNGTLDLQTGKLRKHDPKDSITKLCPVDYDQNAQCPKWEQFLESVFNGQREVIDFLQRFLGYSLTGSVAEQILTIFWGSGSNGKSTLLETYLDTLGSDYAMPAAPDFLMAKRGSDHPTAMADLLGKRFVSAVETEQDKRLAEAFVKTLTGGDRIRARRMREDFWEFLPTHKLVLSTNHRPKVKGSDHAIWRRLVLVPFKVTFWNPDKGETGPPEIRQDKFLPAKLKTEAAGILAWVVRGCLDWQAKGLNVPYTVRAATAVYQSESDVMGRFTRECCLADERKREKFSDLYAALQTFCEDLGFELPTKTAAGAWLEEHGYQRKQSGGRWYLGISLLAESHHE